MFNITPTITVFIRSNLVYTVQEAEFEVKLVLELNWFYNQPTNQRSNWGGRLTLRASRRPSVCIAIPALTASLGSITDT